MHRTRARMPTEAPRKKPRRLPGLKGCCEKRLRFRHLLGVVLQLLDGDVRDHRAKLLRRLEHRDRTSRHFDGRACARISRHARLPMADLERAETADLDVLLFLERFLDGVEERIDDSGAILLRDHRPGRAGYLGGYTLDQIGFRHGRASEGRRGGTEKLIELMRVNSYVSRAWRISALPLSDR